MAVTAGSLKTFELIGRCGYSEQFDKESLRKLFPEYVAVQEKSRLSKENTILDENLSKEAIQVLRSMSNGSQIPTDTSLLPFIEVEVLRDKLCASKRFTACDAYLRHACSITFGWNPEHSCTKNKNEPCSREKISLYTTEKWFIQGLVYLVATMQKQRGAADWKKWLVGKEENWIREYSCYRESDVVRSLAEALLRGNFLNTLKDFLVPSKNDDPKNPKLQNFFLDFAVCREFFKGKRLASIAFRALCKTYPCTLILHGCDLNAFFEFFEKRQGKLLILFYAFEYRDETGDPPPFRIYKDQPIETQFARLLSIMRGKI